MKTLILRIGLVGLGLLAAGCVDEDTMGPSTPTHLDFVVQPTSVGVGSSVAPSIAVAVRDDDGETVWTWTTPVSLSLESEVAGAVLQGTTTATPVGGTALFEDLLVAESGSGYQLIATSGTLEQALSQPFGVHQVFHSASVVAGSFHTCALTAEGVAYCWGTNTKGQLGDGTLIERPLPTPVTTELRFASLTSGANHTCGLTAEGTAYCWGANSEGELGAPTTQDCTTDPAYPAPCSTSPIQVSGGVVWDQLSAGYGHTCGLTAAGEMYCWGDNAYGQVGDGTEVGRAAPTPVSGGFTFSQVSTGYLHSCALTVDGQAYCWGSNIYGEVGDSTHTRRIEPTAVYGDLRFVSISAGGASCHGHSCGIATDGTTYCWGKNYQRHINEVPHVLLYAPVGLVDDPGLERVVVGANVVCGLTGGDALYCWGDGSYGQVGNGSTGGTESPAAIRPDLRFTSVSSGRYHTCGSTVDGPTYCWGMNTNGQLGDGSNDRGWTVPVPVWRE